MTKAVNAPAGRQRGVYRFHPLLAALRPVANALGGTFQYFGWFTLTSFALQGRVRCAAMRAVLRERACLCGRELLFSASPIPD